MIQTYLSNISVDCGRGRTVVLTEVVVEDLIFEGARAGSPDPAGVGPRLGTPRLEDSIRSSLRQSVPHIPWGISGSICSGGRCRCDVTCERLTGEIDWVDNDLDLHGAF